MIDLQKLRFKTFRDLAMYVRIQMRIDIKGCLHFLVSETFRYEKGCSIDDAARRFGCSVEAFREKARALSIIL